MARAGRLRGGLKIAFGGALAQVLCRPACALVHLAMTNPIESANGGTMPAVVPSRFGIDSVHSLLFIGARNPQKEKAPRGSR
jgi:hypothetical protein